MKINYEIKEVKKNIFAVIVPDTYHLAMLFCRAQEYYESPSEIFRGSNFNIWDYIEWYSKNNKDCFTYANDWAGFNIPFEILESCYSHKIEDVTPYDRKFLEELSKLFYYIPKWKPTSIVY
jgi:hypothetical protein